LIYKYYENDGAYFRGFKGFVGVQDVWDPERKEWTTYTGGDRLAPAFLGSPVTQEEAETGFQYFEKDGRYYRTQDYSVPGMEVREGGEWKPCDYSVAGPVLIDGKKISRIKAEKAR
jgi:hypothetical protein